MTGLFVAIVGPSGAGKDSLIREIAARLPVHVARRVVTRAADATEDHDTLDEPSFLKAERAGRFALSWSAHGLRYGVPREIDAHVAGGRTVIANLSRGAVEAARQRYPRCLVVLVTARPDTLAQRLAARGRENIAARESRLARAIPAEAAFKPDAVLDNDGSLEDAAARLESLVISEAAHL